MRRRSFVFLGLLLLAAAAGTSVSVQAAVLLALDLPELVRTSEHVVVAKAETRAARKAADSGLIVTDVRLRVVTGLKGGAKPGETLVATLLGGSIGDVGLHVPGEAIIPEDRSALVFLRRNQQGELNVTGMGQGALPIVGQGKAAAVHPAGENAELVQAGADGKLREAPGAVMRAQPLAGLLTEIRRIVAAQGGGNR